MKMMMMFMFSFGTLFGPGFLHKITKRFTRETKMSPRGPSLALKRQTTAFKKPSKTLGFLVFLGPETSQETLKKPKSRPRSTQRAPKARKQTTKKNQDKCLRGKKCLKPAISLLTKIGTNFRTQICTCFKHVLHIYFYHFFEKC